MTKQIDEDVNQFPSLTWHRLHINHAHVAGSLAGAAGVRVTLQEGVAQAVGPLGAASGAGQPAATQLGAQMDALLDEAVAAAGDAARQFTVAAGTAVAAPVRITYTVPGGHAAPGDGAGWVADAVIVAEEGSESTFVFDFRGTGDGECLLASRIRVYAAPRARVHIATVNLLGQDVTVCSGVGTRAAEDAAIEVTQVELGARAVYTGCRHVLAGSRASAMTRAAYLAAGGRTVDVNYIARHEGRETRSDGAFGGAVLEGAGKTWRGTIEFPRGCVDAAGDEQENVLLLSPDAVNKSMPVILCDEEAVEGRHGASIGRIGPDVLLYMQSRGMDEAAARAMMVQAAVNAVARFVPDGELAADIQARMEGAI